MDQTSLLALLSGRGQGMPEGIPLGGQAFPTPLSGIPFGEQGMGLSGGGSSLSGRGAAPMGGGDAGGGIDPLMLQQLMSAIQGAGTGAGLTQGVGGGSLGQYGGGYPGSGMGYGQSGPAPSGVTGTSRGTAQATSLKEILGGVSQLTKLAQQLFGTASPLTRGDAGGTTLSDQMRSQQADAGTSELGAPSPTASPTAADISLSDTLRGSNYGLPSPTAGGPTMAPNTFLSGAAGPASYGDVFLPAMGSGAESAVTGGQLATGSGAGGPSPTAAPSETPSGLGALGTIGTGAAGIGGLYELMQGIQQGRSLEAARGGVGALGAAGSLGLLGDASGAVGTAAPYAGAALGIADVAMNPNLRNDQKAALSAVQAGGAIAAPYTFGLSALAPLVLSAIVGGKGGAPGWLRYVDPIFGNMIYSLFQQGNYAPTREKAFKEAQAGIGGLGSAYQQAAQSGDPAQVLKALGTAQAGGHLRAGLNISPEMAQALGMAPGAAEFANVSPEQFGSLLGYYGKNPQAIGASITGSGDVPYMPQKQAVQIAGNIASNAQNVIRNTVMRQQVQNWLQGLQAPVPAAATPAPAGGIPPSLLALMGGGGGATQDPLLLQLMLQGAA